MRPPQIPWWAPIPIDEEREKRRKASLEKEIKRREAANAKRAMEFRIACEEASAAIDRHNRLVAFLKDSSRPGDGKRTKAKPSLSSLDTAGRGFMVRPKGLNEPYGD